MYAELGSTWFLMLRRPVEAAHVLGKLLVALGPERIVWGTDSTWYGSPQPLIDAFRAFRIPERMQAEYGYPAAHAPRREGTHPEHERAALYDISDEHAARPPTANATATWVAERVDRAEPARSRPPDSGFDTLGSGGAARRRRTRTASPFSATPGRPSTPIGVDPATVTRSHRRYASP